MRISLMKSAVFAATLIGLGVITSTAHANNNFFALSGGNFFQDWSNAALITANDNWTNVPSITGYLGDGIAVTTNVTDPQTLVSGTLGFTDNVLANQVNPNGVSNGGFAEFTGVNVGNDSVVAFQGSGTADAPFLLLSVNAQNRQNLIISYLLRDIDTITPTAGSTQPVALQFRLGTSGNFTNLPAAFVANAATGGNTSVSLALPATFNNQAQIQFRMITRDASGSDQFIGIDDISVTSAPIAVAVPEAGTFALIAPVASVLGMIVARRRKLA